MDYNKYLLLVEFCTVVIVIGIGLWSAMSVDRDARTRRRATSFARRERGGGELRRDGQNLSPD